MSILPIQLRQLLSIGNDLEENHSLNQVAQACISVFNSMDTSVVNLDRHIVNAPALEQINNAKTLIQGLIDNFKLQNPGDIQAADRLAEEINGAFLAIEDQVTHPLYPCELSKSSWQVERYENTFNCLKQSLRFLHDKNDVYFSLMNYVEREGAILNPLEKKLKNLLNVIQTSLRNDATRYEDSSYFNLLFSRYHHDFFNALREILRSPAYQNLISQSNASEVDPAPNYEEGSTEQKDRAIALFAREFSGLLYTNIHLEATNVKLVESMINHGAAQRNSPHTFNAISHPLGVYLEEILPDFYKSVDALPSSITGGMISHLGERMRGQLNLGFDPNTQNNPIHKIGEFHVEGEASKVISNLAFGSQTVEYCYFGKAKVSPEFQDGFLENYRAKGKRHLYVFHQNLIPPLKIEARSTNCLYRLVLQLIDVIIKLLIKIPLINLPLLLLEMLMGNESGRGEALIELANEDRMKETFYFLGLTKTSRFYNQSSSYYESMNDAKVFKAELLRQFFELDRHQSGIYISPNLLELVGGAQQFREDFEEIVSAIHEELFSGRTTLTLEERKNFIAIVYTNLDKHFLVNPNGEACIDSVNTSCRADIDRGMSEEALLQGDTFLKEIARSTNHEDHTDSLITFNEEIAKTLFARAMLVYSRVIIHQHFERALEAIKFLASDLEKLGQLDTRLLQGKRLRLIVSRDSNLGSKLIKG